MIEGGTDQHVRREIVADHLRYLSWPHDDGYPGVLQLRHCDPAKVVVDPDHAFGQPIFVARLWLRYRGGRGRLPSS